MGKIMEALFCIAYLLVTGAFGMIMLRTGKESKQRFRFGILTLILVGGDAFHLVPRIYGAFTGTTDELYAALGFGTLVTSITMTIFYVLFWEFWRKQTNKKFELSSIAILVYVLAACRLALCLFPQNDWLSSSAPLSWGIYRNIPFAILGGVVAYRLFTERSTEKHFKYAWLAVTLSFLFYLPVVLFTDALPVIGMLMIPKTVCYVWLVVMGYNATNTIKRHKMQLKL